MELSRYGISLALLANISISEKNIKLLLQWYMCINGHLLGWGVSQGISWPNADNCSGFPHHWTVCVLEAENTLLLFFLSKLLKLL